MLDVSYQVFIVGTVVKDLVENCVDQSLVQFKDYVYFREIIYFLNGIAVDDLVLYNPFEAIVFLNIS